MTSKLYPAKPNLFINTKTKYLNETYDGTWTYSSCSKTWYNGAGKFVRIKGLGTLGMGTFLQQREYIMTDVMEGYLHDVVFPKAK